MAEIRAHVTFVTGRGEDRIPAVRLELTPPLRRAERSGVLRAVERVSGVEVATITGDLRYILAQLTTASYHYRDEGVIDTARAICREVGVEVEGDIVHAPER